MVGARDSSVSTCVLCGVALCLALVTTIASSSFAGSARIDTIGLDGGSSSVEDCWIQVRCIHGFYNCSLPGCQCDPGWTGTNCSMCIPPSNTNSSLSSTLTETRTRTFNSLSEAAAAVGGTSRPLDGVFSGMDVCSNEGGVCSTSLFPSYNTTHQLQCTVPDPGVASLLSLTEGSIAVDCETNISSCSVHVWHLHYGPPEIFQCAIHDCAYTYKENILTLYCGKAHCWSGPNWQPSAVLQSILDAIAGWMSFVCDIRSNHCTMHQKELQELVVPLQCYSGDCVPSDFHPPPQYIPPFWTKEHIIIAGVIGTVVAGLAIVALLWFINRRRKAAYARLVSAATMMDMEALAADELDAFMFDLGFSGLTVTVNDRTILRDASGYCAPGTVTAIMGPSGAGKTTLLSLLAGKTSLSSSNISGTVLVNGLPRDGSFKRIAGFVTQDDFLIPTLTVRETLDFHALLRLGSSVTPAERVARVEHVIQQLELEHVADSRIGDKLIRGISGGERRRVSIATELVTSPRILFLDEPTSGLDACTASAIMTTLRELASSMALTVILSIHQPRSSIFAAFDSLILLSRGSMLYNGRAAGATAHFAQLGHTCPAEFNPADYLIDLVTASPVTVLDTLAHHYTTSPSAQSLSQVLEAYLADGVQPPVPRRIASRGLPELDPMLALLPGLSSERRRTQSGRIIDALSMGDDLDEEWEVATTAARSDPELPTRVASVGRVGALSTSAPSINSAAVSPPPLNTNTNTNNAAAAAAAASSTGGADDLRVFYRGEMALSPYATSVVSQTWILCQRTWLNVVRNPALGFAHYAVTIVVALIIGGIYFHVGDDWPGLQNRAGSVFFIISLLSFGSLSALDLFIGERAMFLHERSNGCYRTSTYFVSKLVCDMIPLRIIPPLLLTGIVYFMIGLRPGAEHFVWMAFILTLVNVNASGLCMAIGAIVPSVSVGNLIGTLSLLFMMLFGGLLLNKSTVGPMFIWLQDISITFFAYEALLVNQLEGTITNFETSPGVSVELTGEAVLDKLSLNVNHFDRDIFILVAMSAGYMLLTYTLLRVRAHMGR